MTNQKVWELSKQVPVQDETIANMSHEVLIVRGGNVELHEADLNHLGANREAQRCARKYPDACIIVRDYRGVIVYTVNERALEVEPVDRWANEGEHDTAFNEGV